MADEKSSHLISFKNISEGIIFLKEVSRTLKF